MVLACDNLETQFVPSRNSERIHSAFSGIVAHRLGTFPCATMKEIRVSGSDRPALVDDEDYLIASRFNWHLNNSGYAAKSIHPTRLTNTTILLHRVLMGVKKGQFVDHINHDTLDNRRLNLRIVTLGQNCCNRIKVAKATSKFKGVGFIDGKFRARINFQRRSTYLGVFDSEIDAAEAYNKAASALHGEYACLNKI